METRQRKKRKSPCNDIIFEVCDNDMSSGNSSYDEGEPEPKISKMVEEQTQKKDSNLENFSKRLRSAKNAFKKDNDNEKNEDKEAPTLRDVSETTKMEEHGVLSKSASPVLDIIKAADAIASRDDYVEKIEDTTPASKESEVQKVAEIDEVKNAFASSVVKVIQNEDAIGSRVDNMEKIEDKACKLSEDHHAQKIFDTNEVVNKTSSPVVNIIQNADAIVNEDNSMEEGELNDSILLEKTVLLENNDNADLLDNEKTLILDQTDSQTIDENTKNDNVNEDITQKEMTESISITFSNKNISDLYRDKFLQFLQNFVEFDVTSDNLSIQITKDYSLNPTEWVVLDESFCVEEKDISVIDLITPVKKHKKKPKNKKNKAEPDLFVLDTNPSEEDNASQLKYNSKFMLDFNGGEKEEEKISSVTCFNCGGAHSMRDCVLPKDYSKINAAKKKFMTPKNARYHLEDDQRFAHIVPGQISDSLRHALGLSRNQIPHYVYYMRMLGYPPGWLEEAKFVHSNLEMFDIDGKNVQNKKSAKAGLDPDKIVEYVGFNAPFDTGFKDEYRKFNTPPYSAECSKQAMLDYFEKQFVQENDNLNSTDMDLDDSEKDDEPEKEDEPETVQNKTLPTAANDSLVNKSLNTLEEVKMKLLEELNNSSESVIIEEDTKEDENEDSKIDLERAEKAETPPLLTKTVLDTSYGTPILKSSSPYVRLPNADNFSKDVSPVINFENLPNSTGKYEQMTGVIQKVRSTLKTLQSNSS